MDESVNEDDYPTWRRAWWRLRYLFWSVEDILAEEKRNLERVIFNQTYDLRQATKEAEWTLANARKEVQQHNKQAAEQLLHSYAQQLVGVARLQDRSNRLMQLKITLSVTMSQVHMMKIHESMAFALDKWRANDSLDARINVMAKMEEDLAETRGLLDNADQRLEQHAKETETTEAAVYQSKPIDQTVTTLFKQLEKDEEAAALERELPSVARSGGGGAGRGGRKTRQVRNPVALRY